MREFLDWYNEVGNPSLNVGFTEVGNPTLNVGGTIYWHLITYMISCLYQGK